MVFAALASPARGGAAEQLPNLVALPPFDIAIERADSGDGDAIRFATGAANRGEHALELSGQPSSPSEAVAQQCIAWVQPRVCGEREEVGRFIWHPQHGHYHFEDFALYELRRLRRSGAPDLREQGLVATSGKISYCIIDVERDDQNPPPLYSFPYPLYYSCFTGIGIQGISPGWRDIYGKGTIGQEIPLEGVPDGTYALTVEIDPADRLKETDEKDNTALVRLRLLDEGKTLEILCAQEPGQDCVAVSDSED